MKKTIVPVSLIRVWPPQSLAIQFSSIQYVAWRSESTNFEAAFAAFENCASLCR